MAGQSTRDTKERLLENHFVPLYFGTVFLWLLWLWERYKAVTQSPPQPRVVFCLAIAASGLSAIVFLRLLPRFRNLNRGECGEMKVAEVLEELRAIGYRCFHDIQGDGFNVDHVVVGPAGVFAIETKFRSGSGEIEYRNGEGLFIAGHQIDENERDPLKQARGSAREVRLKIKEHTGTNHSVKAVLVYVGDWKIRNNWSTSDVAVLSADKLPLYFNRQDQPELTRQEIQLIASHLERSARVRSRRDG